MTQDTANQGLHNQIHPIVKGVIDKLIEEQAQLKQEALALSNPRATAQRLADWNRRAEEALQI